MGIFDDLGKTISAAATSTAQKTKEVAEITKLGFAINGKEDDIKVLYNEIGKIMCEEYAEAIPEALSEKMTMLSGLKQEIADMQAKILVLKKVAVCTSCGAENPLSGKFCANCGAKLPEIAPAPKDEETEADKDSIFEKVEDAVEDFADKVEDKFEEIFDKEDAKGDE